MAKIQELHEHFISISGSVTKDGLIDRAEFTKALGMKDSLFVDRVFNLFDKNGDGTLSPLCAMAPAFPWIREALSCAPHSQTTL